MQSDFWFSNPQTTTVCQRMFRLYNLTFRRSVYRPITLQSDALFFNCSVFTYYFTLQSDTPPFTL